MNVQMGKTKKYDHTINDLPLVSICCSVYNHEIYIRDTLDGFIIQKVDFPIEILINDDCSTDGSADIIRSYAKNHPDIIKPVFQKENQYSKGVKPMTQMLFPRAKGKYIAMCEGDDYWTDPYKLQKQVDFLETNKDFSICFHPVMIWLEGEKKLVNDYITRKVGDVTSFTDLVKSNYMHTPSVMFKYGLFDMEILKLNKSGVGDYFLHFLNAQYGKIKMLPDNMAVYRVHSGGVWSKEKKQIKLNAGLDVRITIYSLLNNSDYKKILKRKIVKDLYLNLTTFYINGELANSDKYELAFCKNFPREYGVYLKYKRLLGNPISKWCIKQVWKMNEFRKQLF
jgi:glycosyltransferase involved in cell wall biosynthesis